MMIIITVVIDNGSSGSSHRRPFFSSSPSPPSLPLPYSLISPATTVVVRGDAALSAAQPYYHHRPYLNSKQDKCALSHCVVCVFTVQLQSAH